MYEEIWPSAQSTSLNSRWSLPSGEHGTHNGPKKADAYVTLKPGMSADNLSHKGGHAKGGYAKGY